MVVNTTQRNGLGNPLTHNLINFDQNLTKTC